MQKDHHISKLTFHVLAALLLTTVSHPVFAQRERDTWTTGPTTFEVTGQVRNAESGEPATNAQVRLERFSGGVAEQMFTDDHGRFRFTGLQRGYYTVVVIAPGFNPVQQTADLQVVFKQYLIFELTRPRSISPNSMSRTMPVIDARVPESAQREYVKAHAALLDKRAKDAIPHLEKAVFVYPDFFEAQLMLGTSYMDGRQWEKAEKALERAREIKPDNPSALFSLGEVYWRQKRYDEAEKALQEGLKLDDKSWHGYFTLGRLYWDKGEVARAAPPTGKTLQLKPDFAEAHLLAGNILLRVGQQERALIEYQEYLRLAPKGEFAAQARDLSEKLKKSLAAGKQ